MDFPGWYRNLWYHRVFIIEGYAVVFLSLLSFALCHCNFKDRRVPHWAAHCTLKLHLGPCFSPWLEKKEFLVDPCPWFPLRWPLAFFWSLLAATDLLESHRYFIWKKSCRHFASKYPFQASLNVPLLQNFHNVPFSESQWRKGKHSFDP